MARPTKRKPGIRPLPDGTYRAVARVRINGEIRQKSDRCPTVEAAKVRVVELRRELREGAAAPCSLTRAETVDTVLCLHRDKLRAAHRLSKGHESKIEFLRSELGKVTVAEVADRFEKWLALRPSTPVLNNRVTEIMRASFNSALAAKRASENPITRGRFTKTLELPRHVTLDAEGEKRLLAAVDNNAPWLRPFVEFSLLVPSRKSELTRARREHVNMIAGTLFVPAGNAKARHAITKPLPPTLRSYFTSGIPDGCPWVFFRKIGGTRRHPAVEYRPLGDMKHAWATVTEKAGLSLTVHDMRHIAASRLASRGVPTVAINAVAGWRPGSDMLGRYWNETPERLLKMVDFGGNVIPRCDTVQAAAG
jgi:integrase